MASIAVIGGGIIGLSIGWQLARANLKVQLFEQRLAGKQASWAAAGMLSPYSEAIEGHQGTIQIGLHSLALYPAFLKELSQDSGLAIPQESEGTLYAALCRDDREWLHRLYTLKKNKGIPAQRLSGEEARQKEPLLSPRVNSGLWIPSERQINNRLLLKALIRAFSARGGTLKEQVGVVEVRNTKVHQLEIGLTNGQNYCVDLVINTTGAWANQLDPSLIAKGIQIRPIKGQLLNLSMQPNLRLSCMVRTPRIYLAPKQDGRLCVGATSEDTGYNEEITAGATLELLEYAHEILPAIFECTIEDSSVGLRPMPTQQLPFMGASSVKGLYHAIGHGRAGILLAPYTAYLMKQLIEDDLHAHSI